MSAQEARRKGLQEALAVLEALDKLEGAYERQGAAALTTGAERWAMRLIWSRGKQERRGASRIRQVIADVADNIKNKIFGVAKVLVIKYVALMESGKIKSPEDLANSLRAEMAMIRLALDYIVRYGQKIWGEVRAAREATEIVERAPAL